ncbi:hypothetical protein [Lentilactobacillus hilgardii]|uniref:hypothetical protein n=1 Tax=Lentilactobacillus hilgardii TaxID=1588 RepID=UPI003FA5EDB7
MEDQKVINYSLHTLYKTSLAIAGVTLFSFSLGMAQPSIRNVDASSTISHQEQVTSPIANDISIDSNLKNDTDIKDGGEVNFTFSLNIQGAQTERIHPGDTFKVQFDPNTVDMSSFTYVPSTTQNPAPALDDIFKFTPDAENNSLTLTATKNVNLSQIQQLGLHLEGRAKTPYKTALSSSATASFTPNGQSKPLVQKTFDFKVSNPSSGSDIPPQTYQATTWIFGNVSGAALYGQHGGPNSTKYSDNWLDNSNDSSKNEIHFVHNQDAMLAYAQLALPSNNAPKSVEWDIRPDGNHTLSKENTKVLVSSRDCLKTKNSGII